MLSDIEDLPKAVSECERVLKPGKFMLVYVTQATELLSADSSAATCSATSRTCPRRFLSVSGG